MKNFDIVVIGSGLYVCGRGTEGYGTVLPAIFEWKRENINIGKVHCVSTSIQSAQELLKKAEAIEQKTGVKLDINAYPKKEGKDDYAYRKVLNDIKKPACAIVAVPDHLHYEVTKDCLNSGLHTLLVKPFTPTLSEGQELVYLANAKGLYGAVEFHKRWDKSNLLLKDKFLSRELGDPLNCWIEYSQRKSIPLSFFKEWASKTSVLQYLGVHYIDIIRFITAATPKRVMAIGQKTELVRHKIETYNSIQSLIEWEMSDGSRFTQTLLTSWVDPETSSAISDQKIKFVGTKGRYEADQKERGLRINTEKNGIQHINPDFCMPYGVENGLIEWKGYGIDSIKTFLNDVIDVEENKTLISELQSQRPSFKESIISSAVIEAAHTSLENESIWQSIDIIN